MKPILLIISLLCLQTLTQAQPPAGMNRGGGNRTPMNGNLYGKLIETKSEKPIEYASVQLVTNRMDTVTKKRKEVVVAGMITKANGEFRLENVPVFGQLKLRVSVVGFKPYEQAVSFDLKRPDNNGAGNGDMNSMMTMLDKDLGNIKIDIEEKVLDNVTVSAGQPGLRLAIDRKVFNVDKNIVSAGGTGVDVMKNIPGLSVDIDNNVTMRNNSPQIFVDGRPTTMSLDQIPADAIESVEMITNPSAKYDASGGTAGILNVVLKKNKKVGYNGGIRTNIDSRGRFGFGGDINLRQEKVNFFLSANYNQRKSISTGNTDRTTFGSPDIFLNQVDKSVMKGSFGFYRGGLDYFIDNRNTISVAGNIASGSMNPYNTSNLHSDYLSTPVSTNLAFRSSQSDNHFNNKGTNLSYKHNYPKNGKEWTADFTYNSSSNNSSNLIKTDSLDLNTKQPVKSSSQRQDGKGSNANYTFQTDYSNPLSDKSKIEAGARVSIRNVDNRNDFYLINSGIAVYNPLLSVNYNSSDKVYAGYVTYSNQLKKFGYQLGLRAESSNYQGHLPDKGQDFTINFPVSLFPSVFLNTKMKKDQELQLNYTRKINRPNFFQLYPYTDYSDTLNISRGNPGLKPEFTNNFELSYQKTFKNKDNFIASFYYKNTTNLITRYQVKETTPVNQLVNTYINASSSYVSGFELVSKNKLAKWWDLTSNLNLFTSKINTGISGQPQQDAFVSWFGKLNNQFKLVKNLTLQISGEYTSKTVLPPGGSGGNSGGGRGGFGGGMFGQATSSQGYVRANYFADAGLKFDFLKNRAASLSLNVNDIFRSRRSDVHSESPYFTQDVFRRRDPQVLRLSFNWRFGKFDPNLFKRKNMKNQNDNGMDNMNMGQ